VSSNVFVINQNGHPLMPCHPAKARKLLRDGKARVIGRSPFTIKLLWDCEEHTQEVVLGIDKGSALTGFCCVGKGHILLSGEIHHRKDVKVRMQDRRTTRRNRRSRKWYRPARFLNRASSKRSGRLPPSIKTNVEEVIRVVETLEQDAETYDKELRKQMKKLEAITKPLPAAAVKPADAAKPAGVEDEVPMGGAKPAAAAGAKPAAAKAAEEPPAEEVPMAPPAAKAPVDATKAPLPPDAGKAAPPAAAAPTGKAAPPPAAAKMP